MVDTAGIQRILFERFELKSDAATINDDGTVDIRGNIRSESVMEKFPVKFGTIRGSFDCGVSNLRTLENGPFLVEGDFKCYHNYLTDLKGAPREIRGSFNCCANPLKSLQGSPEKIGETWYVTYDENLPLLRMLVANQIGFGGKLHEDEQTIENILNQFAGQGKRGVPSCMVALNNLQKERGIDLSGNMKW